MAKLSKAAEERAAAKKQLESGGLTDRDTYTAKQVATRCGTDSKTMRKFFRSSHSTIEPVGQGGRYEFDAADFPQIKREFDAWQIKIKARRDAREEPKPTLEVPQGKITPVTSDGPDEAREYTGEKLEELVAFHYGEDYDPTPEELADLAELEAELEEDLGPDPKVVDYPDE